MAFWNKSDDPWDRRPGKQSAPADWSVEEKEPEPGLLDQLKGWNETRLAEKEKRETPPEPIPCPWCGKTMAARYLVGGRDGVYLRTSCPKAMELFPDAERLDTDGGYMSRYKFAWYCADCGKLVLDFQPEPEEPYTPKQNDGSEMDRYLQG